MDITRLRDAEGLRTACEAVIADARGDGRLDEWGGRLADYIHWFQAADEHERATEAFQRKLWDDNPVSAVGQGNINVDPIIVDAETRAWLAHELARSHPSSPTERRVQIVNLVDSIRDRVFPRCNRAPFLKLFRLMATAFPHDFTTIADRAKLKRLHESMFGPKRQRALLRHFDIVDRLDEVLGPVEDDSKALAERMILPWLLYAEIVLAADETPTEEVTGRGGDTRLAPLPASRRRRGLTAIRGGFETILGILEFVGEGVRREELCEHIRSLLPGYKDSSLGVVINALIAEFSVIRREGELYLLTERGEATLDSGDPSDLSDWLLTRILGVDAALVALRDDGPLTKADLTTRIKACNPGWTSGFMSGSITSWLRSFGLLEGNDSDHIQLTETGRDWADRIHWTPERLAPDPTPVTIEHERPQPGASKAVVELPPLPAIVSAVQSQGHFDERIIHDLHSGLWAHEHRHFSVLTGLSGTGKTLLASAYARALWPETEDHTDRLSIVTVQPGWYDPGALLGYVNPLRPDAYVRTPFLDFLIAALSEPQLPYVVILDEMNLSHPEQYLAPILSAMETRAPIDLHREGDEFDGIPSSIPYPSNLVIIGTVNMDETTHGLSDKVLDRAFTMEFWDVDVADFPGWKDVDLSESFTTHVQTLLTELHDALRPARLHFGWRTIEAVIGFLSKSGADANKRALASALDSVVYAKVLPKLRGDDSPRFRQALDSAADVLARHDLSRSRERVDELKEDLKSTGTARFWR